MFETELTTIQNRELQLSFFTLNYDADKLIFIANAKLFLQLTLVIS